MQDEQEEDSKPLSSKMALKFDEAALTRKSKALPMAEGSSERLIEVKASYRREKTTGETGRPLIVGGGLG